MIVLTSLVVVDVVVHLCANIALLFIFHWYLQRLCRTVVVLPKWSCYFYQERTERANERYFPSIHQPKVHWVSVYLFAFFRFACLCVCVRILMAIRKMVITCAHKSSVEWKWHAHAKWYTKWVSLSLLVSFFLYSVSFSSLLSFELFLLIFACCWFNE